MMKKIVVYSWPWSQKCMECMHGEFIQSETLINSDYFCEVNCEKNNGIECEKFNQTSCKEYEAIVAAKLKYIIHAESYAEAEDELGDIDLGDAYIPGTLELLSLKGIEKGKDDEEL